jgi:hypothetical protein
MFSPKTIIEVVHAFRFQTHSQIDQLALEFGFSSVLGEGGIEKKETRLMQYLTSNQTLKGPHQGPLVLELAERAIRERCTTTWHGEKDPEREVPELLNALRQDGFMVVGSKLQRMFPDAVPVAGAQDELTRLLDKYAFSVAKGHLTQVIAAHTRGDWAAANAQLRSFFEELFDRIASGISGGTTDQLPSSHARREWLAACTPPFLDPGLNEWESGRPGGFVQGLWKRLHPQGSHPGLSDEADATFRLHLVILSAQHYLSRYERRS